MGARKLNTDGIKERMKKTAQVTKQISEYEKSEVIPISDIDFNEDNFFNKFDTEEDIDALIESIKENGLIHPVNVMKKGTRYLLISGERRLKAYKKMGKPGIRATIVSNLSDLDILKRTFYGNTDVRNYTLEQKLEIISMYKDKLDELSETGEYDVAAFKNDISKAFNISSRQTEKLVTINDGLIDELVRLMCMDKLDINSGAKYSVLPEECQKYIYGFFNEENLADQKRLSALKDVLSEFAGKVKTINTKYKNRKRNALMSITYNQNNIESYSHEMEAIDNEIASADEDKSALMPALIEKKNKLEKSIARSTNQLNSAKDDLQILKTKSAAEVESLMTSYEAIINQRLKGYEPCAAEAEPLERIKKAEKEIRIIERSVKKLNELFPAEELNEVLDIIDAYRTTKI